MSNTNSGFKYQLESDGIATVTMDMPGQSVNTMNDDYIVYMDEALNKIKADLASIKGIIIASAKKTFFAGGDIKSIMQSKEEQSWDKAFKLNLELKNQLTELEKLGVPVVAAINGAAIGGGFEICLACHHRIALDSPRVTVGLPEVSLGLLPAGGGIVRTVRLLGLQKAFPVLVEGKRFKVGDALSAGLIDELAASPEEMITKVKTWILANPDAQQPWLAKGYKIPGGDAFKPHNAMMLAVSPAMLHKKTKGLMPAPEAILAVMSESTMCGYDSAMLIESRYFSDLLQSPESTALIKTLYFQMNEIAAGASRPSQCKKNVIKKVGILGAGMMGRGIAYSSALSGVDVILKDISVENAEKGKQYSQKLLDKHVAQGRKTEQQRDEILARITPSADNNDLSDCDLIIEAVFENLELKIKLTQEIEPFLKPNCIWGSNTSTLPIGLLAEGFSDPSRFIGVHFFSPVDKMMLVEIISGKQSSDETLAFVYDYVTQIRKTPIVVNDGRGFYTSRVFGCFVDEGLHMLTEGVNPAVLENITKQAGMPVGPLSVMDEVEIELMRKVGVTNQELDQKLGDNFYDTHSKLQSCAIEMCELGRSGRASGKGWYDYHADGSKTLWTELPARFGGGSDMPLEDIKDRIMFRQVVETLGCIERGVLMSSRDANIGSIFGWGFPAHTGGAIQFIDWFGGQEVFEKRRMDLETKYGSRFSLDDTLDNILAKSVA
ncbi:MAG: 3-hydroxyacyl-CoA dehydrogenase [Alteromonadaceae bacterium]|uniref:3-hydroxyacyl-CoA dehydrogenase NAD-binding domain-containing protein n=1 Tax=Paraglaciecola chathamensis TaxID=368405 RepID=UPI000C3E558E|nr:3-hydroxyacyl-CoA dehydrogenase NAD-binding domain-containing protein [Paraglaciecola agarilytica]MBN24708.1 3-hydroxyacyl-CoA dehydrogenase [Alteromonadaceae bacterium]|tara:strand:+ start:1808 stop:3964 length:2157 start_codon:yes stop_codon:yes gene_type:complete